MILARRPPARCSAPNRRRDSHSCCTIAMCIWSNWPRGATGSNIECFCRNHFARRAGTRRRPTAAAAARRWRGATNKRRASARGRTGGGDLWRRASLRLRSSGRAMAAQEETSLTGWAQITPVTSAFARRRAPSEIHRCPVGGVAAAAAAATTSSSFITETAQLAPYAGNEPATRFALPPNRRPLASCQSRDTLIYLPHRQRTPAAAGGQLSLRPFVHARRLMRARQIASQR